MSPQPPRPDPNTERVVVQLARPERRVTLGMRPILDHLIEGSEKPPRARRMASEEQRRRQRVARLARELRDELTALAALRDQDDQVR